MRNMSLNYIEETWKLKTNSANELFNKNQYEKSLKLYKEALIQAELLNENPDFAKFSDFTFVPIFAISCNNLAFNYEELKQVENGKEMLQRAIYFILI